MNWVLILAAGLRFLGLVAWADGIIAKWAAKRAGIQAQKAEDAQGLIAALERENIAAAQSPTSISELIEDLDKGKL